MPRQSSEERAAAYYRAGAGKPFEPPDYLNAEEKALWQQIVASKPNGRFDAGSGPLLEMFVCFALHTRWLTRQMAKARATTPEAARLERRLGAMSNTLAALSAKLRLSVQASVDRRSGELDEPGDGDFLNNRLLGGTAINRRGN